MQYGAIDLHKKETQIRILLEDGEIVDRRIATTRGPRRMPLERAGARAGSS